MAEVTFIDIPSDPKEPVTLAVDVSNAVPVSNGECINNAEEDGDVTDGYLNTPKLSVVILQFDAQLKDPDLQVLEVKENKCSIIFMPPNPGLYSMVIKYNDENVSGSPLQLNLSPPDAKQVSLTKPPTGKLKTGQSINIWFNSLLAGRGHFTAICKGEELGDIPVTITSDITGNHKVSFLPPQEDEYSLSVCYSGKHVKGSPYKIDLIPVKPNLVKCSQPVFPKGRSGLVEMDVCTEGSGNAQLTATCAGSAGEKIPVNIDKVSKDNYHLKIDPPENADLLTLTIKYGGKQVQDSPFLITVAKSKPVSPEVLNFVEDDAGTYVLEVALDDDTPPAAAAASPVQVTFGDLHIPEVISPTHEVAMDVDFSVTGHGFLTAEYVAQGEDKSFTASIEEIEPDSKYRVKFTPVLPDIYTLTICLGGDVLPGGVFEINLLSKPCAKLVRHLGTSTPHDIGEPVVLKFDASKAGPGTMRGRVNGVSQAGRIDSRLDLVDEENGIYHLTFIPDGADMYNVDMYWCDESIPTSPIYITITYPKEVTLSVPANLQVNHSILVNADTTKAGPGDLTACCSGVDTGETVVKINKDSYIPTKYMIYFLPNVADLYILRVYFDGIEIKHSPIEIDLHIKKKRLSLEPVHEEVIPVHQEVILVPQEVVPVPQEVFPIPQEEVPVPQEVVPVPQEEVPVPQEEIPVPQEVPQEEVPVPQDEAPVPQEEVPVPQEEVPVPQEEVPVPQEEVPVPQEEVPVPQEVVPVPQEMVPTHPITKPYVIQYLDQLDSMDGLLAYAVDDDPCIRHTLRIRKGKNGKTFLVFYPQNTGLHFIHIMNYSKEVRGSPFKVEITDSNPLACVISNVPEKSYVNEAVVLKIDASKAGDGDLNILATVPTGGRTAFDHSENGNSIFTIRFTPKVVGKHRIDVKWAGMTVPDSPITINVSELTDYVQQARDAASKVTILEESSNSLKDKLLPSNGIHFYVKTDQIGQGKLTLKSEGPANPIIKIYEQDIDLYRCKVNPVVSGIYHITILWNDIPIPNNPFKLDFTADKTYIINDLNLGSKHFDLHQPYTFRVNCGQNKGTLQVMATPMDSALVEVNLLKNNIYSVKIIPQVQGNHDLSLKFAGKHILQSPYNVQFESAKTQTLSSYSSVEFESTNIRKLSEFESPKTWQLSDCLTNSMKFESPNTQQSSSVPGRDSMAILSASGPIKIIASGPGLQGGIIGQEGNFIIETDTAVKGKLEISIQGPKGTFKMRVRHHPDDDRTLLARYDPTHIGEYTINILWREKHIEGSPFVVDIKAQEQSSG